MQRLLAISDIHGESEKLLNLLNRAKYDPEYDKLILLGDYVDRGPEPMKTLQIVQQLVDNGAVALIGNHDLMFLNLIINNKLELALMSDYYRDLGSYITINQYNKLSDIEKVEITKILKGLIPYYERGRYIFVHAGVNADKSLYEQTLHDLVWIREDFYYNKAYDNRIIIFGHTQTPSIIGKPRIWVDDYYNDKIDIDCGCVYGGKLACIDLTNKLIYYV